MAAILVSQNNNMASMLVHPKPILWDLNSFFLLTLSFFVINVRITAGAEVGQLKKLRLGERKRGLVCYSR